MKLVPLNSAQKQGFKESIPKIPAVPFKDYLIKSYTNLFYYNYSRTKIKERAGLLAISVFVSNSPLKVKIERKISKFEVFASLNANEFYKFLPYFRLTLISFLQAQFCPLPL